MEEEEEEEQYQRWRNIQNICGGDVKRLHLMGAMVLALSSSLPPQAEQVVVGSK